MPMQIQGPVVKRLTPRDRPFSRPPKYGMGLRPMPRQASMRKHFIYAVYFMLRSSISLAQRQISCGSPPRKDSIATPKTPSPLQRLLRRSGGAGAQRL